MGIQHLRACNGTALRPLTNETGIANSLAANAADPHTEHSGLMLLSHFEEGKTAEAKALIVEVRYGTAEGWVATGFAAAPVAHEQDTKGPTGRQPSTGPR